MKKLFFVLFIFFSFKTTPQECKGNCENGFGTITYLSGSSYQGEFLYGMKHGHGIYKRSIGFSRFFS